MIAVPDILDEERIRLKTMVQTKIWNGVNFLNTDWNGEIQTALDSHKKDVSLLREDVQNKLTPNDDWLVITVDYHS